jgi:hypothetical protein
VGLIAEGALNSKVLLSRGLDLAVPRGSAVSWIEWRAGLAIDWRRKRCPNYATIDHDFRGMDVGRIVRGKE